MLVQVIDICNGKKKTANPRSGFLMVTPPKTNMTMGNPP